MSVMKQTSIIASKRIRPLDSGGPKHAKYAASKVDMRAKRMMSKMNIAIGLECGFKIIFSRNSGF